MPRRIAAPDQDTQRRKAPRLDFAAVIKANISRRPEGPRVFADRAHI